MNAKLLIPAIAGMLLALSAHAHDCSGGTEGGMDASGNQCNDTTAIATNTSTGHPAPAAPAAQAKKAPLTGTDAARRTAVPRHSRASSTVKAS